MAFLLSVGLTILAVMTARQPIQTLRFRNDRDDRSAEDRRYFRAQAWRRLFGSGLFLVLAAQIAGAHLSGLEAQAVELGQTLDAERERTGQVTLNPEQLRFRQIYAWYWISVLLLVLVLVVLAAVEVWAIRGYHRRHLQQIRDDRQVALEEYAEQMRRERHGRSGL
jgi:hypothetical protein